MRTDPGPLPDRPLTLKELREYFGPLQDYLLEKAPGTKEAALRQGSQKRQREGFYAYLFGSVYGALFGCRDILRIHVVEALDYDALISWQNGPLKQTMRLQLKELVSPILNRQAGTAEAELSELVSGLPNQYPNATDLTVAIFANRDSPGSPGIRVQLPEALRLEGLWIFGWSKRDYAELFIYGGPHGSDHLFFLPWKSDGERH